MSFATEDWEIGRIRPYPNNPRVMRNAAEKVAESIREFGWRQPIVVDEEGVIIIGHTRLAAAQLLKLTTAPVHVAKGLSADKVRALRLADNKTGEFAGWDQHKLGDELQAILAAAEGATVPGFSQSEIDAINMQAAAELAAVFDAAKPADPVATAPAVAEKGPAAAGIGPELDDHGATDAATPTSVSEAPDADLVQFTVLTTLAARQVMFDAIAKAKAAAGYATAAEALHAICQGYLDAA